MSYAIHPYAIRISDLQKLLGSGDTALIEKVRQHFADEFEEIDELDDEVTPVAEVIAHLINGSEQDEDAGFKYGYGLKFICEIKGQMLTNRSWSSVGFEWIEEVDEALGNAGVPAAAIRVGKHLTLREAPVKLPKIYDFPSIGYLRETEMGKASMALKDLRFADDEVVESVTEVQSWLDHCTRKHADLVCFYH